RNQQREYSTPPGADRQTGRQISQPPAPPPTTSRRPPRPNQNPPSSFLLAGARADPFRRRRRVLLPPIRAPDLARRHADPWAALEAAAVEEEEGGDGAPGNAGAVGVHQRHTQLPQQGAGAPPRRQGARQHPHALQEREGQVTPPSYSPPPPLAPPRVA